MPDPTRRRRTAPLAATTETPDEPARPDDDAPLALVVDDEADQREVLRLSLSLKGWTVIEATSGEEAIRLWTTAQPDIVLLDQQLHGMTGLECARTLRERSADTRIIMFTGYLDAATTEEARRLRILPLKKVDHQRLHELLDVLAAQLRTSRRMPAGG